MDNFTARTINQHQYNLSFGQQELIEENVDNFSIIDLTRKAFKDDALDERTMEYHDVRKFVDKIKRNVPTIEFTEEQLKFIHANAGVMKPLEMAKNLFPGKNLKPLSKEPQTVKLYLDAIGEKGEIERDTEYRAPKSATVIVRKINKADNSANFNINDLSPIQQKCVDALRSYLQSIRFIAFINIIEEPDLRDLFEEEFIKGTYDKPDLNSEELNMYITLCGEYVNIHRLEKQKVTLGKKIDDTIEQTDSKLFYTWVDMYQKREEDLHKSKKRAEDLQKNLSSTRSRRMQDMAKVNESLAKFVEEWKTEEGRKRALIIAEANNIDLEKEMDRLESFEEYIAKICGVGRDEILHY